MPIPIAQSLVSELASLLHLTSGSAVQATRLADETASARVQVIQHDLDDECESVMACLAASYLPSLVRYVVAEMSEREPEDLDTLAASGFNWLQRVINLASPYMSRFAREHPDDALALFHALARRMADYGKLNQDVFDQTFLAPFLLLGALENFFDDMLANASAFPDPEILLDDSTRTGITLALERLPRDAFGGAKTVRFLTRSSVNLIRTRGTTLLSAVTWPYWTCETRSKGERPTPCARLPKGKEMSLCSRCLTVRYCSQAHQKADWKRHKLLCFKPTW